MKKWIIPLVTLIILVGGVAAGIFLVRDSTEFREKAAPATTLSFSTQSTTVNVGESFVVSTQINSGENQLAGVQLAINYDPAILQVDSVTKGNFLGAGANTTEPVILTDGGLIDFVVYLPVGSTPVQGTGTIAIISFTALVEGTTTLSFTDEQLYVLDNRNRNAQTQAYGIDEFNVLASTTPLTIIVQATGGQPTATPTPTEGAGGQPTATPTSALAPTNTPTPTPTPTTDSGIGGSNLPTSTPTPAPTNTPTPTTALIAQNNATPTPAQLMNSGVEDYTIAYLIAGSLAFLFSGLFIFTIKN